MERQPLCRQISPIQGLSNLAGVYISSLKSQFLLGQPDQADWVKNEGGGGGILLEQTHIFRLNKYRIA
jgi:hypothetical protein